MKEIPLTQGRVALVDDDDYERVMQMGKWQAEVATTGRSWYAKRTVVEGGVRSKAVLHRLIVGAAPGDQVDHKDGNGLNCTRSNLRICSAAQNRMNVAPTKSNTSGYKGVHWSKRKQKWCASISVQSKNRYIGYFVSKEDAARAYDSKASELFGEFAWLNFPEVA